MGKGDHRAAKPRVVDEVIVGRMRGSSEKAGEKNQKIPCRGKGFDYFILLYQIKKKIKRKRESAFSFAWAGPKEKAIKKKGPQEYFVTAVTTRGTFYKKSLLTLQKFFV